MPNHSRRSFLKSVGIAATASLFPYCRSHKQQRPNLILCMADDLGWADTGYHGHPDLQTPNLDEMSRTGIRFERFYSAAPVCSPTRGSCLTGRHPFRYGIFSANVGHLPNEEVTLAEIVKPLGYTTGHFGKWHLGTLTKTIKDSNRGGREKWKPHYSPPWENGFDVCFSTEAKVPTYDPMRKPAGWQDKRWWNPLQPEQAFEDYNTRYWTGPEQAATEDLIGDDSKIIMNRALDFIENAVTKKQPFFTVIWFHVPHWPVVAGKKYRHLYSHLDEFSQNHLGCITAMDEQIGRLRDKLKALGVEKNTMLWFCSDNGPEGTVEPGKRHGVGSAGILRGRKRNLYEGGIRVPGLLVWPDKIKSNKTVTFPCCTSDYFPTILDVLGVSSSQAVEPLDGLSLLPLFEGQMPVRPAPIAFESGKQIALIDNRYKLISRDKGETYELYDLINDPGEKLNLAEKMPSIVAKMQQQLTDWQSSCEKSLKGEDYF